MYLSEDSGIITFGIWMIWFLSGIYWSSLHHDLMTSIWEKAISIFAGNLNSSRSYLITAVLGHFLSFFCSSTHGMQQQQKKKKKMHVCAKTYSFLVPLCYGFLRIWDKGTREKTCSSELGRIPSRKNAKVRILHPTRQNANYEYIRRE